MADRVDKETRSRIMRSVGHYDTKPELALRRALFAAGLRGWRCHRRDVAGTPDLAFVGKKVAVFVDGAFWHGHPDKYWQSSWSWTTKGGRPKKP